MSIFKRLSATMKSHVNQIVGEIEDHDAVIESAIRSAHQAVARSRVRLAQMNSDGGRMRRKLAELKQMEAKWAKRAREVAKEDEEKAIQCLQHRNGCIKQATELALTIEKHQSLEERLVQDIQGAETRVMEISQQRKLMRTRQSTAEALSAMNYADDGMLSDVSAAFERWEVNITEEELEVGTYHVDDTFSLEKEFIDSEKREAFRKQLKVMMDDKENNNEH